MSGSIFSRVMSAITPHSDNYFILFNKLADCAVRASKVLAMMTAVSEEDKFEQHFAEIRKMKCFAEVC